MKHVRFTTRAELAGYVVRSMWACGPMTTLRPRTERIMFLVTLGDGPVESWWTDDFPLAAHVWRDAKGTHQEGYSVSVSECPHLQALGDGSAVD